VRSLLLALVVIASAAPATAQDVPDSYAALSVVHVHFESATPGVVLSEADGHGGWTELGIAPLDLTLPRGTVTLALAMNNHAPVPIPVAFDFDEGVRLLAHYESRQTLRELGVGIMLGTAVFVLIGIAIAIGGFLAHTVDVGIGGLVGAGCVGLAGGTTGIALATLDDLATIDLP
jgi:hypothetical protein